MAKIEYPEGPLEREYLRDALRRQGRDSVDEVAEAIQRRWHHSPLRSYRLAAELSLEEACKQVNKLLGVFAEEAGYFHPAALSRYEYWPATSKARRPGVSHLLALAQVYRTNPRRLIDLADWGKYPAADRFALDTVASQLDARATEPVEDVGMMGAARPPAGNAPQVPPTWWATPEPIGPGNPIERLATLTGEESARYGDRASAVGPGALDQVRSDVAELSRKFGTAPTVQLFGSLRLLRDRIFALLDTPGRLGVSQVRDLHFLGGAACGLLANATNNLGYVNAALSHVRTGLLLANEAGADTLAAWLHGQQATIYVWNGQYSRAREAARQGQNLHPSGTVSVFLPAVEARASGELGNPPVTRAALRRTLEARETVQPGPLDEFGGLLGFTEPKQHFYAASAYLGIGEDAEVVTEAEAAINGYRDGPAEQFNYPNTATVQFHAAVAHVRGGDLDAARPSASAALDTPVEYHNATTVTAARQLHNHLRAARLRDSPTAIEVRDRIEDFLSVAPARLELA